MAPSRSAAALLRQLRRVQPLTQTPHHYLPVPRCRPQSTSSTTTANSPGPNHSSVNASEISHFNALASSWWEPHGPSRPLHLMNPLRHDFIRACHASQPDSVSASSGDKKLRYLDIGCGGGIFAESAARLSSTASVTAIDPSPEVLAVARAHASRDPAVRPESGRLNYLNTTIEALPTPRSPEEQFDVVSVFEVVEHVDAPAAFLDRCGVFVKPGGWLVLSTIARTWMSWFVTNVMAEDVLRMVPRGTHDWNKYINDEELSRHFAKKAGWNSPRVMGVVYVPGVGWKEIDGSEKVGNYFFGIRKDS